MVPLAAKGFRPFFLAAATFAALLLPAWLAILGGALSPALYLDAVTWHAHELIFGFAVAVIAGFLLTAVGNWTGRETLVGWPLLLACAVWGLGRAAMAAGGLPRYVPALVDLAFLPLLVVALARPLVATRNRRNFVMVALLGALWTADLCIHLDALGMLPGARRRAMMFSVDVIVLLMVIVSGRVVPMFTKNATRLPWVRNVPWLDRAAIAAMVLVTLVNVVLPATSLAGVAAGLTALLVAARAWHWGGRHVAREPLLWILHAGHAWIVIGLGLRAVAAFSARVPPSAAAHALTVGAIGALTLGMMVRVSLGHTGRRLAAPWPVTLSFAMLSLAALVRVFTPIIAPTAYRESLFVAGSLWTFAFALFVATHLPILTAARADGKAG